MDYVIAMRFHAAVFAYRNGINFTGISYDKKCASFLKSVGKEPVEIRDVTWKALQKQMESRKVSKVSKVSKAFVSPTVPSQL